MPDWESTIEPDFKSIINLKKEGSNNEIFI